MTTICPKCGSITTQINLGVITDASVSMLVNPGVACLNSFCGWKNYEIIAYTDNGTALTGVKY